MNITAENDGIKVRDALLIYKGSYTVKAQGDGIVTTNEKEQGNLSIDQGTFAIEAQQDGLQSAGDLTIYDGVFTVTSGGGSVNRVDTGSALQPWGEFDDHDEAVQKSKKGIKAAKNMVCLLYTSLPGWDSFVFWYRCCWLLEKEKRATVIITAAGDSLCSVWEIGFLHSEPVLDG